MATRTKPRRVSRKPKPTEHVSRYIRIDVTVPMHRALRLRAADQDTNLSALLRKIISDYLESQSRRNSAQ